MGTGRTSSGEGPDGLFDKLWKRKLSIILAFALMIAIIVGANYYLLAKDKASQLNKAESDYNTLNGEYSRLSDNYSTLLKSDTDLNGRYTDLNSRYNKLSVNDSYLQEAYNGLNGTISRFQETGGAEIALYYRVYQSGTQSSPTKTVEATAYNVGNKRCNQFTINCMTIVNGSSSISDQTFTNVDPLDKRLARWVYANNTVINSIWVDTI